MMLTFLDKTTYLPLIIFSLFLGLAPFVPMPHLLEKIIMLAEGRLNRAVDIFDLFFHLAPSLLLLAKLGRDVTGREKSSELER